MTDKSFIDAMEESRIKCLSTPFAAHITIGTFIDHYVQQVMAQRPATYQQALGIVSAVLVRSAIAAPEWAEAVARVAGLDIGEERAQSAAAELMVLLPAHLVRAGE